MESEDGWSIISWHLINVLHESRVLRRIWDVVVELSDCLVEAIVLLEDGISQPEGAVCIEQLSVKIVSDSASVLHFTNHVLNRVPRVGTVCGSAL